MVKLSAIRLYSAAIAIAVLAASPAYAQYKPRPVEDPATGEKYHIEFGAGFWNPTADINIASESLGIAGTEINFKNDLGMADQRFWNFRLVLRPSKRNKLRAELIPIRYEQSTVLNRTIVFNGQKYNIGIPVNSSLDWKAWRFSYEFDAISRDRGFFGIVLDAKYTDVQANLQTPINNLNEYAHAQAPIPALGVIGRVYVVPNIAVTGEFTAFKLPNIQDKYEGHYSDLDIYGTVNFTNSFGVEGGWRSFDLGYFVKTDTGTITMHGLYFGAVVRY